MTIEEKLFNHQKSGIDFLKKRPAAMLADEMGLGKSRQALVAAHQLYEEKKIDRMLVLCPATVRYSWQEEIKKLREQGLNFILCDYKVDDQKVWRRLDDYTASGTIRLLSVVLVSYGLMPQERHVDALEHWCKDGNALLVCDESSFLKTHTSKQQQGAKQIATQCLYRWLLTGTPIANGPIDLYGQGDVMTAETGKGPMARIKNFYSFRAIFFRMGGYKAKQAILNMDKLPELQKLFFPYILRREKKDCLDLPPKTYTIREVALCQDSWKTYQELKREALLALPDRETRPEPNAAVRIMRLCQLTSGHVTVSPVLSLEKYEGVEVLELTGPEILDVSNEKLFWATEAIVSGELETQDALIVWCRWRRERERLAKMLRDHGRNVAEILEIYGGQSLQARENAIEQFQKATEYRRILLAQPHAGGFGLTLTKASVAVYLSNDFSYIARVQSEDRCHRIGQKKPVTYVDVLATGPQGQRTIDHYILECLKNKKGLADMTCAAWRRVL
jgi:SNF2 family DNA or RNA helicase